MKSFFLIIGMLMINNYISDVCSAAQTFPGTPLLVKKCADFSITGNGSSPEWNKTEWNLLTKLDPGAEGYVSKFKIMYSRNGIYVLFDGKDNRITTTFDQDFDNLFEADVFEVFFHPDPKMSVYFEYEINPLNRELVLIIPNVNGKIHGWIPWRYEKERKVIKKITVQGGKMEPNGVITSWNAELFFPYGLLSPLANVPPEGGMVWHANFCRLDYDTGKMVKWAWAPVQSSFHEYEKYLPITFE